jgi:hypothetical protein
LHIAQAQFLTANQFSVRISAVRAWRLAATAIKIMAAVLTVVPDREDLDKKLRTLCNRASRNLGENMLQAGGIENPTPADFKVNAQNPAGGVAMCRLVHCCHYVICDFAFVHAPPRQMMNGALVRKFF